MNPSDLQPGTVVRWRTGRTAGIGQYAGTDPDGNAIVRAWLPTRSKVITTTPDMLTVLPDLTEDVQRAATVAGHIAAGLR